MDAVLKSENCTLNFDIYPNIEEEQKKLAFSLLIAGIKMVERLGGKRRRGNGNCKISIVDDATANQWLKWLQSKHENCSTVPQWKKAKLENQANYPEADSTWLSIPLTITTLSPIVLPKRTVGNVVECLDYIPGRYFLGYLHKVLGQHINVGQAIADGDLVMTNATIDINGVAGRPTPFCLFGEKLNGGLSKGKGVYNRFEEAETPGIQLKGERSGYVGEFNGSDLPQHQTVKLELNTHNTIDDTKQRPTRETGGAVYSYQAIPAGNIFKVELRLPKSFSEHLGKNWQQKLKGTMRIGQSKKDQYGSIDIKVSKTCEKQFNSSKLGITNKFKNNLLYVWFLSDVLMRDRRLNPTTNPDVFREVLATELGVTLEERKDNDLLSLMMKSRRTESWHVGWGLPRPSMLGWQAGSCVVYEVQGEIKAEKLAELEARGIGDRRAEGYGQICFNDPLLTAELPKLECNTRESESHADSSKLQLIRKGDPSFNYARMIETAAWREAIENKALAIAANPSNREKILGIKIDGDESKPPMSQLGGLRSAMRRLTQRVENNSVKQWIDAIKNVDNRKNKWPNNSLDKIRKLVTDFNLVWQELGDNSELTVTQNAKAQLQENLWPEAVRTLVYAIIRAHKRDLE